MMPRDASRLTGRFDAVICGGGIYGAWCAFDAALRGLKVAVVDRGDWAGATSSSSSKLIHGGLRYLEMLDIGLVKKALRERQMLLQAAPHRIWPLRFGIPVYRDGRLGRLRLKAGLSLYDFLAGTEQRHRYYSAAEFARRFPFLDTESITCGFDYFDAQTDDARLVLELIDGAEQAGAVCLNYCRMTEIIENRGRILAVKFRDSVENRDCRIETDHVVNAAGPWLAATEVCRLSKGVHLVMPGLLDDMALLLTARADGRVFFMMPWYGMTLIGTTDADYRGDPARVRIEPEEIDYLLSESNRVLQSLHWHKNDIIGRFAGLRVLRQDHPGVPSQSSRDWELRQYDNGLLTSIGGKITSARADAARIVDALCARLGIDAACHTFGRPFPWAPSNYPAWSKQRLDDAERAGVDLEAAGWLLRRYGSRIDALLEIVRQRPYLARRIVPSLPFILAEVEYCARTEAVVHLDDLLRRRIPLSILAKPLQYDMRGLAALAAPILHWNETALHHEIARFLLQQTHQA